MNKIPITLTALLLASLDGLQAAATPATESLHAVAGRIESTDEIVLKVVYVSPGAIETQVALPGPKASPSPPPQPS